MRKDHLNNAFLLLAAVFVTALVVSNIVSFKLISVLGFVVPAGVFMYPVTFAITDIVSEVYGKKKASQVVLVGFISAALVPFLTFIAVILPPAEFFGSQEQFATVLGAVPRVTIASLIAYLISQWHDVWAFHFWKRLSKGKFLWLRNNLSTMVSQLIDTVTFITIAFAGVVPTQVLINMIFSQYLFKILIAAIDTPFVYLGVKAVTGHWEVKEEYYAES
ncbi:queuosine precursor transporter [Kosmotoga pacifica]|uniref:Probable queuosine precursor transporter n=1 Tax=Kosmotoga pacifica TaxID=1330330 RepID=A0A0G2ZAZ3_9BACT|nr:queuosine precursor transporter [Kosmotoga pacifica]AKI96754.1 transporter [Kosmotoga pacifica]